jgi:CPA1 family monovalent cation:H+ antiporter
MHSQNLLILSGILFAGFACQWAAWRLKLPSILLLLTAGIVAGPILGVLDPDEVFGDLLEPVVSLAVAVILYEGSLTLKLAEIRGHGNVVRNLVTVGAVITWVSATAAAHYLLGWDLYLAALFGAIVIVSGPTVIVPLLRSIRPTRALASIFRWEGILIDPLGAVLAVLVFNFIVVRETAATTEQLYTTLVLIVVTGVGLGITAGHSFGNALRRHWVPDYLRDYAALAWVILVFGLSEAIEGESGLLAVTIMGVWQANMRNLNLEDILDFKESLTLVLVAGLFIILAARVDPNGLVTLGPGAIAVLVFLQFIAGPIRGMACSIGSQLSWRERIFLGWLFPRGIVAAAVSALFALRLENLGYAGAERLVPMVFTIIVGTVVFQSLTGGWIARKLGVADPEPNGVLIIGANPVALAFANALRNTGRRVLVASMSWDGISDARMAGLPVFYGSPVSAYAERHLDLIGLGYLVALSHRPGLNELACERYKYEFGRERVFTVPQSTETEHEKHQISGEAGGRLLFDGNVTLSNLMAMVTEGYTSRITEITGNYSFDDYRQQNPGAIVLFVVRKDGSLQWRVSGSDFRARAGWQVVALVPDENTDEKRKGHTSA